MIGNHRVFAGVVVPFEQVQVRRSNGTINLVCHELFAGSVDQRVVRPLPVLGGQILREVVDTLEELRVWNHFTRDFAKRTGCEITSRSPAMSRRCVRFGVHFEVVPVVRAHWFVVVSVRGFTASCPDFVDRWWHVQFKCLGGCAAGATGAHASVAGGRRSWSTASILNCDLAELFFFCAVQVTSVCWRSRSSFVIVCFVRLETCCHFVPICVHMSEVGSSFGSVWRGHC